MVDNPDKIRSISFHEADHLLKDKASAATLLDKTLKDSNANILLLYPKPGSETSSLFEQSAYMMQEYSYTNGPKGSTQK